MEQQIGRYGCEAVVRGVFDMNDVITQTPKITPTPTNTGTGHSVSRPLDRLSRIRDSTVTHL